MPFKAKWYVHADKAGLEKIARLLRLEKPEISKLVCVDKVERELLKCNYPQWKHVQRQLVLLHMHVEFYSNEGHGIRLVPRPAH